MQVRMIFGTGFRRMQV